MFQYHLAGEGSKNNFKKTGSHFLKFTIINIQDVWGDNSWIQLAVNEQCFC
jgi:hypothetical protein